MVSPAEGAAKPSGEPLTWSQADGLLATACGLTPSEVGDLDADDVADYFAAWNRFGPPPYLAMVAGFRLRPAEPKEEVAPDIATPAGFEALLEVAGPIERKSNV